MAWEEFFFWFNGICGTPLFVSQMCFKSGAQEIGTIALIVAAIPFCLLFIEEDFSDRRNEFNLLILSLSICGLGVLSANNKHMYGLLSTGSIFLNYFLGPELSYKLNIRLNDFIILGLSVSSYLFLRALKG